MVMVMISTIALSATHFTYALYALSFVIPFAVSSPQLVTGTLVNCFLFLAADRLRGKALLPILVLPSLGTVGHGVLFGPNTVFLYYFLPCIWIGNYILTAVYTNTKNISTIIRIILASGAKYLFLITFARVFVSAHIVPPVFISAMGHIQLVTAVAGGLLAYAVTLAYERRTNTH